MYEVGSLPAGLLTSVCLRCAQPQLLIDHCSPLVHASIYLLAVVTTGHLGMSSVGHTPAGRGFDKSLVYFEGAEDHFTQRSCCDPECIAPINESTPTPANPWLDPTQPSPHDLWIHDGTSAGAGSMGVGMPATHLVESAFNGYLFNDFAVQAVESHDLSKPLFMYLAPASAHSPLQAPQRFIDLYPPGWNSDRRLYAAECSVWDEILGNVTAAMKARPGMWENTLLVFSAGEARALCVHLPHEMSTQTCAPIPVLPLW